MDIFSQAVGSVTSAMSPIATVTVMDIIFNKA